MKVTCLLLCRCDPSYLKFALQMHCLTPWGCSALKANPRIAHLNAGFGAAPVFLACQWRGCSVTDVAHQFSGCLPSPLPFYRYGVPALFGLGISFTILLGYPANRHHSRQKPHILSTSVSPGVFPNTTASLSLHNQNILRARIVVISRFLEYTGRLRLESGLAK